MFEVLMDRKTNKNKRRKKRNIDDNDYGNYW